jgi:Na+-driven multidrug efflux pump
MVFSLSNVVIQSSINAFGDTIIAGSSASNNVTALTYQFPAAIYSANLSFAGQCYGAGKFDRIEKLAVRSCILAMTTTTLLSLVFTFAPYVFLGLFSSEQDVLAAAVPKLLIVSWSYLLYGVAESLLGILRGLKRTTVPTVINIMCVCVLRVLWIALIFPLAPTPIVLYLCYPVSYLFDVTVVVVYYLYVRKKELGKNAQRNLQST